MNPLSLIRQFIRGLTKETEPYQIGLGIAFGTAIGLIPKSNLTAQLLLILLMATKANLPFALITIFSVSALNPLFDRISDPLGYFALSRDSLAPFFTSLYNMPIAPWTDFNNTVLLGGLILGLALFFPCYLAGKKFGVYYNAKFKERFTNSKIVKSMKKSWLLDWYFKE